MGSGRKDEATGRAGPEASFRRLPSVEEVLRGPELGELLAGSGAAASARRALATELVRAVLDGWRAEIRTGRLDGPGIERRLAEGALAAEVRARLEADDRRGWQRVVNATGVVLHTGLGRAPVHPEVAAAMAEAAGSYGVLEVDRDTGARNERDGRLSELVARLTGAEAAIAVNNNAAAVLLALNTYASDGGEVIVSRGELVEIGGSFRVPDVMARAGAVLREVGTTNRTRMEDYRAAAGERTALLMKVHTSNFRVRGFTHEVTADELATLGTELDLPTCFDLGSGLLETPDMRPLPVGDEPRLREAVSSGVDLVTYSGDKLLGGPQAGIVVGKRAAVLALRKNPLYRAMRCDKVALAGLERTLTLMLEGRGDELPARRMLLATADELRPAAERLARELTSIEGLTVEVAAGQSQPGSGSAPDEFLDSSCVRVTSRRQAPAALAERLRQGEPPVFCRVQEDAVWLDVRTLLEGDFERLVAAFGGV